MHEPSYRWRPGYGPFHFTFVSWLQSWEGESIVESWRKYNRSSIVSSFVLRKMYFCAEEINKYMTKMESIYLKSCK